MRHRSKMILYVSLLLIFTLGICASLSTAAAVWYFIDGDGGPGINLDISRDALQPALMVYQGDLYTAWTESNGTANQIRVKKYRDGIWNFVDGGVATGLNGNPGMDASHPTLTVYNGTLVAAWIENTVNGSAIRVKKYDGNSWSWMDEGGLNYSTEATAGAPALLAINGQLYATWAETALGGANGVGQIRVKKYTGNLWTFVDGGGLTGLNYNSAESAANPRMAVFNSTVYAAWEEFSGGISQIRVKKYYNGDSWAFIDGGGAVGLNWSPAKNAGRPQLMECNGAFYAAWEEENFYNPNFKCIRFKKYNGTTWTFIVGGSSAGINKNPTSDAKNIAMETFGSFLYLTWTEGDFSNEIPQIRAARSYNGGCAFIDGNLQTGLNKDVYTPGETSAIAASATDLYLAWSEKFGNAVQIRVKKWPLPAKVTSVILPADGTYGPGQTLNFTVNFSKPVTIGATSPPTLYLNLDTGGMVNASYVSGSGTNAISFSYTVQSGNLDTNGITIDHMMTGMPPMGDADNYAEPDLRGVGSIAGILVDGVGPKVLTGTAPASGTYIAGQNLDFALNFNEPVFVDTSPGIPELPVTFDTGSGSNMVTVKALYIGGSGTNSIIFRYTVKPGDLDTNGVSCAPMYLTTNGAIIRDAYGNNAQTNLLLPGFGNPFGILVDAVGPAVSRVNLAPPPNTYVAGRNMDLQVSFSEAVTVNTNGGAPYIPLTFDSGTVNATYLSGTGTTNLVFRYTIQSGDLDQNGVVFGPSINLNGGTMRDNATNDAVLTLNNLTFMTGILVDGVLPAIVSVTGPPDGVYNYFPLTSPGNKVITVYFNEPVKVSGFPTIPITLDTGGSFSARYYSGSGSNTLVFSFGMIPGSSLDLTGITLGSSIALSGGTITDNATNNAILTLNNTANMAGVLVDNIAPTVASVAPPTDGIYVVGQDLNLTVNFNEPVIVNTTAGTPYIQIIFDNIIPTTVVQASYVGGSGTNALTFRYTVKSGDMDTNGFSLQTSITANGGTIRDIGTNNAVLTLNNLGSTAGIQVIGSPPSCWLYNRPGNQTYIAGQSLDFTFKFNEPVFVDTTGGIPYYPVTLTNRTVNATYISGSGTSNLLFRYTLQTGDLDADGISISSAVIANGATIRDILNVDATLTFSYSGSTSGILVDAVAPTVTSVSVPSSGAYKEGSNLNFTVKFSENVKVTTTGGIPYLPITLDTGGTVRASYVSGTGTTSLVFRYTVQARNSDSDGILPGGEIVPNGGILKDTPGNEAVLVLNNVGPAGGVRVDTTPPLLVSATRTDDTHLTVALNEACVNLNQNNDGGFTLAESGGRGLIYPVLATAQGTNAGEVILTVPNLDASAKYGLVIKYSATGNGTIRDSAGNILPSNNDGLPVAAWSENRSPQPADPGPLTVGEGQLLRFTLTGTDPDQDPLTYTAGNLPAGAVFNPVAAEFSWIPTYADSGIYSLQFTVSDGEKTASQTVTLTVADLGTLVQVFLLDSHGAGIAGGQVTYAGSSWQTMGTTDADGKITLLLPSTTSVITVRMSYQGMSRDLAQNINYSPNFTFATVNTNVILKDSAGNGIAGGEITYAGSSWLSFGTTDSNGEATKELLPGSYKFRMTYAGASLDQTQNVATNPQVSFGTRPVTVILKDSAGNGIAGGVVTYSGSSWSNFGTTDSTGAVSKELLPVSYKFRMTYAGASVDQTQDTALNPAIGFQTRSVLVTLKDSSGNGLAGGVVTYAGSSWLSFGTTNENGEIRKELLTASYTFRMTYTGRTENHVQEIGGNDLVAFSF